MELDSSDEEGYAGLTSSLPGKGRKRSRQQTKDDATYGIFQPSYGSVVKEKKTSMPIAFVSSSSKIEATIPPAKKEPAVKPDQEQDTTSQAEFVRLVRGPTAESSSSSTTSTLPKRRNKPPPAKLDKAKLQTFKKYGKNGFALKFLQKFNFKGTLGKHGTGISEPIAVKARPERLGLDYGGFKEATTLESNRKIHAEQFGETELDAKRRKRKEQEEKEERELRELWKKVKQNPSASERDKKQKKKRYKTSADLLGEKKSGYTIVDMRGEAVKYHKHGGDSSSSDSDSSSSSDSSDREENKPKKRVFGKEILFNMKALVSQAETELNRCTFEKTRLERTIDQEVSAINALKQDTIDLKQEIIDLDETISILKRSYGSISEGDPDPNQWSQCLKELRILWSKLSGTSREYKYQEDIATLQVASMVFQQLSSLLFQLSLDRVVIPTMRAWTNFLLDSTNTSQHRVDQLLSDSVLDTIELEIGKRWRSCTGSTESLMEADEFAVSWLDLMSTFISARSKVQAVATRAVMPELERRVNEWKLNSGIWGDRLDLWIFPWLGHLRKQLRVTLHRPIRQKLVKTLSKKLKDESDVEWVICLVRPWAKVVSGPTFERIITEGLIPRLVKIMRNNFEINPGNQQNMGVIKSIMRCAAIIPRDHFCSLFEGEFFPKFLRVLFVWINSATEDNKKTVLKDVVRWYKGWKEELTPLVMLRDDRIEAKFGRALGLIAASSGWKNAKGKAVYDTRHISDVNLFAPASSYEIVQREKDEEWLKRNQKLKKSENQKAYGDRVDGEIKTREFLDLMAAKLGATFMREPKGKINGKGKPIYLLMETVSIVIDSEVCYVGSDGDKWKPIAIEDLLSKITLV